MTRNTDKEWADFDARAKVGMAAGCEETRATTLKPGTRCECRNPDCPGSLRERTDGPREACRDDAVRLVTVREKVGAGPVYLGRAFALCAACAEYHERGSK